MVTGKTAWSGRAAWCPRRRFERPRVDERLEDGAGGPLRDGVIHLRRAVAAPAHQRQHLAGVRIERDQRHLRIDVGLAQLLVARMQLVHLLVHHVNGGVDRVGGQALQIGIERGVDAQPFAVEVAIAELLRSWSCTRSTKYGASLASTLPGTR